MNMVESNKMITEELLGMAKNGKVSCSQALALAEKLGVSGTIIGQTANVAGIKITGCQLGCFGAAREQKNGV